MSEGFLPLSKGWLTKMESIRALPLICAVLIASSCGTREISSQEARRIPPESAVSVRSVVGSNNRFAFDMYGRMAGQDGNLFFSPIGITTALAQVSAGSAGETFRGMVKALSLSPEVPIHESYGALLTSLNARGELSDYDFLLKNWLWVASDEELTREFIAISKASYFNSPISVNLKEDSEPIRKRINREMAEATRGRIKDAIPQGGLNPYARLLITNAVYFHGLWKGPFPPENTSLENFYSAPGDSVLVPMMHQSGAFRFARNDTCDLIALPYKGDDLAMAVFLPRERNGLDHMEALLERGTVNRWLGQLVKRQVIVELPRFRMNTAKQLGGILADLGMDAAFDPVRADFSGITGSQELYISNVHHRGFIEVDEEGTEAAATTAVVLECVSDDNNRPPIFRADHPFVFLIHDRVTQAILFMGRVTNPLSSS